MWNQTVVKSFIFLIALMCVVLSLDIPNSSEEKPFQKEDAPGAINIENVRHRRAVRKPGFIRTLFSVVFEQWADTKNTFNNISRFANELFTDESEPRVLTTTASPDSNVSTTQMPFKITRSEFNRILRRNLLGLVRLYNLELRDALSQNDRVNTEFKKNASIEVSKYL